ncbi:unnamed protein product [Ectocarpus fasciculatus]
MRKKHGKLKTEFRFDVMFAGFGPIRQGVNAYVCKLLPKSVDPFFDVGVVVGRLGLRTASLSRVVLTLFSGFDRCFVRVFLGQAAARSARKIRDDCGSGQGGGALGNPPVLGTIRWKKSQF